MAEARVYNQTLSDVPDDAIYIGRGTPYGNPFVVGKHGTRDEVINRYILQIMPKLDVLPLIGRSLVCHCHPQRCHGDALLGAARRLELDQLQLGRAMLVFGGRDFNDKRWLYQVLDDEHSSDPIALIIEGEASGADRASREWAESRQIPVLPFPANWDDISVEGAIVRRNRRGTLYNAAAGPMRNTRMLRVGRPTDAVGFPGGSGTRDMASQCILAGLRPRML